MSGAVVPDPAVPPPPVPSPPAPPAPGPPPAPLPPPPLAPSHTSDAPAPPPAPPIPISATLVGPPPTTLALTLTSGGEVPLPDLSSSVTVTQTVLVPIAVSPSGAASSSSSTVSSSSPSASTVTTTSATTITATVAPAVGTAASASTVPTTAKEDADVVRVALPGIVIGSVAFGLLAAFLVWYFCFRKSRRELQKEARAYDFASSPPGMRDSALGPFYGPSRPVSDYGGGGLAGRRKSQRFAGGVAEGGSPESEWSSGNRFFVAQRGPEPRAGERGYGHGHDEQRGAVI